MSFFLASYGRSRCLCCFCLQHVGRVSRLQAAQRGLPVLLFVPGAENSVMEAGDYTGGKGLRLMRELLQADAFVVGSLPEAIEITRRYTQHEAHT